MSRFKSTIKALEVQVQRQQQALDELQAENEQMQQKEAALLSSLVTLQCGVSALASASAAQQQQSQDSSGRVSGHCSGPAAGSTACCSTGEDGTSPPAPDSTASAAGQQQDAAGVCGTTSSPASSQAAAQQGQEQQRVVQQLSALECMLEDTMLEVTSLSPSAYVVQQMQQQQQHPSGEGCGSSNPRSGGGEVPPVAARLTALRDLAADPARVQGYLALTLEERSVWLADTTRKLGLLLPKFDAVPSARAELISLTEEVIARGLTYSWLDPEAIPVMVKLQLLNMETGQLEAAFPEGFWTFVAQSLQLSTQQKLALQALWRRVKEAHGVLLSQHDAVLEQLEGLKQEQAAEQHQFAQQAHELPIMKLAQSLLRWRQQQIKPEAVPSPPHNHQQQQQQQQRRHLLPPSSAAPDEHCDPPHLLLPHLVPPPSADERKLEQHLAALRESVALGQQLLTAQLLSCLTHKQLAHLLVCSWPFIPDSIAVCDALDELGW